MTVSEGHLMITIRHTHVDGTLVYGTSKGDGTAEVLKTHRFRWFRSIGLWGVAQSRDRPAKRGLIDWAAEALRGAGFEVTVEIDDTPRDVADVKADRVERLGERREALETKAARAGASAAAYRAAADRISDARPLGQPILVGHHSEARARADQRRIERNMDRWVEEYGRAVEITRRAGAVGSSESYREHPPVIIRRIEKTEAELRAVQRELDGEPTARNRAFAEDFKPAAGAYRELLEARVAFLNVQLRGDREALAAAEAGGYRRYGKADVHRGDAVWTSRDVCWRVVRVSAKSVSVETGYSWTDRITYDRIRKVDCPHAVNRTMPEEKGRDHD
jgi:hypothetical protein